METTERIVESYVRYVLGLATIPNIKCRKQHEIDLMAIDPKNLDRYHIEISVSLSGGFSRLTAKPFSFERLKQRVEKPKQRRTIGFFAERKFGPHEVVEKLADYGFERGKYRKVIVSRGWTDDAALEAEKEGIELWDFNDLLLKISETLRGDTSYFTDDTLRTLSLYAHALTSRRAKTSA